MVSRYPGESGIDVPQGSPEAGRRQPRASSQGPTLFGDNQVERDVADADAKCLSKMKLSLARNEDIRICTCEKGQRRCLVFVRSINKGIVLFGRQSEVCTRDLTIASEGGGIATIAMKMRICVSSLFWVS